MEGTSTFLMILMLWLELTQTNHLIIAKLYSYIRSNVTHTRSARSSKMTENMFKLTTDPNLVIFDFPLTLYFQW